MVIPAGLPTQLLLKPSQLAMTAAQSRLSVAQSEAATGRHDDLARVLGGQIGADIGLRLHLSAIDDSIGAGKQAGLRAEATQNALATLGGLAEQFRSQLTGARNASNGRQVASNSARTALGTLHDTLSVTFDGQYLFGGLATDTPPLKTFDDGPRQQIIAAFQSAFGFAPDDPAASGLTAAQMENFIDGAYSALFDGPDWTTGWSSADDETPRLRLPAGDKLDLSTTANASFARSLAKSFALIEVLGDSRVNASALQSAVDKSLSQVSDAQSKIAQDQARIGISQARLKESQDSLGQKKSGLTSAISAFESVDPYEAATRVNLLMTQLESAYALTGRISKMSLLSYI
jgi:flagellar hook-associated protein 3 FlgL